MIARGLSSSIRTVKINSRRTKTSPFLRQAKMSARMPCPVLRNKVLGDYHDT